MNYPVSEKKCARCSACQLVTKDISGAPLEEKKMYSFIYSMYYMAFI